LIFAIIALCLLIFAPSTLIRKARYGEPTSFAELPRLMFNYTYAFFVLAVKDYHHILIATMSALIGFVNPVMGSRSYKFHKYILLDVIVVAVTVLLVAASLTPSIYIESGLPAPRTMIIPRFIAVIGFTLGGWVAGSTFREIWKAPWLQTSAAVLLLISFVFPVYTFVKLSDLISIYSQRTQAWDAREAVIQQALLNDEVRVTVTAIDGLPVSGIRDFDPKEKGGYWITQCAAEYYGIKLDVVLP
jgi:magnesium-transporting ATPase (P-type)